MSPAASPTHRRRLRWALRPALLFFGFWLLAPASLAAPVVAKRVDLNVQIDPNLQTLYAQAKFEVQNRSGKVFDILQLEFPAPLGARVRVKTVWDEGGELSWRSDPVDEGAPRLLRVALRSPLTPGRKFLLVVSYEVRFMGLAVPDAAAAVSEDSARLSTTGWYPWPADSNPAAPQSLRLTVRLPKQWRVAAPAKLKKLREGTALAIYELELKRVEPGQLLLQAGAAVPP